MIPKIIHYCWFGRKTIPNELNKYISTWKNKCPNYRIILWNEDNFNVNCNEFVRKAYSLGLYAFVSDYARLKAVYDNGGVYLDTDVEVLKGFDNLLANRCFFAIQQNGCYINTGLCFGAEKKHELVKEMMDYYENIELNNDNKKECACPILNTKVAENHGFYRKDETQYIYSLDTVIYCSKYFDPITPDTTNNKLCEETYSIHHYNASWSSPKVRIKRKISNLLGQNKVNFLKKVVKSIFK